MTIDERIKQAKKIRNEAYRKDSVQGIVYWDGYLDELKAVKEDKENEQRKQTEIHELAKQMSEAISNEVEQKYIMEEAELESVLSANGWVKAEEIFVEIEDVLNNIGYFDELDFNALKKKYIGKDTNDTTKETEDVK